MKPLMTFCAVVHSTGATNTYRRKL
jgi:hypothetical protein